MTALAYAVAIIHHGDLEPTTACLASLGRLQPPPSECFVVWNGPGPVATVTGTWCAGERPVVVLDPGQNLGYGGGANLAARAAASHDVEALLLLNNDVEVEPTTVASLLEVLSRDPHVAVAGPRILDAGSGRIWHDGGRVCWPAGRVESPRHGELPGPAGEPFEVEFVCGCAPLIRLAALSSIGGFDQRFFLSYEDVDLGLRLARADWRLVHVPRAVVHHLGSAATRAAGRALERSSRLHGRLLCSRLHAPRPRLAAVARGLLTVRTLLRVPGLYARGRGCEARALLAALRSRHLAAQ